MPELLRRNGCTEACHAGVREMGDALWVGLRTEEFVGDDGVSAREQGEVGYGDCLHLGRNLYK